MFFLIFHENVCCGYLLEAPHQGISNEYPFHMFSYRNKKTIMSFLSGARLQFIFFLCNCILIHYCAAEQSVAGNQ